MTLIMAFFVFDLSFSPLLFGFFGNYHFFNSSIGFRMLFSLFSCFSISLESLVTHGAICRKNMCSFSTVFFSKRFSFHANNEYVNLTFSRSFSFFYIGCSLKASGTLHFPIIWMMVKSHMKKKTDLIDF